MELYNGRPTDLTGREDREIRVYDLLDSLGIEYQRTDHGHADTMEACNEIDAVLVIHKPHNAHRTRLDVEKFEHKIGSRKRKSCTTDLL